MATMMAAGSTAAALLCRINTGAPSRSQEAIPSTSNLACRPFMGRQVVPTATLPATPLRQRRMGPVPRAMLREWPDREFIELVKSEFPDKMVADVEEARVLFTEAGYTYVDVRPALECEEVGKVREAVNIPLKNSKRKYDPEQNKKVVVKEDNPNFLAQFQKRFPDKDTPLLIGCSDGRSYSLDALSALDDAGYTTIVGLKGGYHAWYRVFDAKLRRRIVGEYKEDYRHGADSAGIHASGAGFEKMDAIEEWSLPKY